MLYYIIHSLYSNLSNDLQNMPVSMSWFSNTGLLGAGRKTNSAHLYARARAQAPAAQYRLSWTLDF